MHVEERLWVASSTTGAPGYDFDFGSFFAVRRPWQRDAEVTAVARLGATGEYAERYDRTLAEDRVRLIHSPAEHLRCSQLPNWYPLLAELTPRSAWYEE